MTTRILSNRLKKIETAKNQGHYLEALLQAYHVNVTLLKHILAQCTGVQRKDTEKTKGLIKQFVKERRRNPDLKNLIDSGNVKSVRIWYDKSILYLKKLKSSQPYNTKKLLDETTRICGILNLSVNKLPLKPAGVLKKGIKNPEKLNLS